MVGLYTHRDIPSM